MSALPDGLRGQLERTILKAREAANPGARAALQALAVQDREPYAAMTPEQRALRNRLRAHGRLLGDRRDPRRGTQDLDRLAHECAYEHWHRMLFARLLGENGLLVEPASGVALTLAECEELARERGEDAWALASSFAQRMLPQIFAGDDPVLRIKLPPETRQELEGLVAGLPAEVLTADDTLGWTYQFWQSAEKKRVNSRVASGEKVTGRMLPASTQLFTDHYMVLFLLHNTVGAWHAGRVLQGRPDLAQRAATEQEVCDAVALDGYAFDYLRFVRGPAAGKDDASGEGSWQPAAGTFDAWPRQARELRVLDPCCGSGHFLVAAFDLLVRLRMMEEGLPREDAIRAVLAENLFGLELDARCTQIAAFHLAVTAWRMAGRVIELPELNVACAGLSPGAPESEWLQLAASDVRLRTGMESLYNLFQQAPELGSLVDPRRMLPTGEIWSAGFGQLQPLLQAALRRDEAASDDERREIGVAAQGMSRAADMLAASYHLVITNVPYLKRGKQGDTLKRFCANYHPAAKNDLATVFLERCLTFCHDGGTAAVVLPQNWLFLTTYRKLREKLLKRNDWHVLARLGPGAFETVTGEVVKAVLVSMSPGQKQRARQEATLSVLDASVAPHPVAKAACLRTGPVNRVEQEEQLRHPDARVTLTMEQTTSYLSDYAQSYQGICSGDFARFGRCFWEFPAVGNGWIVQASTVSTSAHYSGRHGVLLWEDGRGELDQYLDARLGESHGAWVRGLEGWGKRGIAINQMTDLSCSIYSGTCFDNNVAIIIPHSEAQVSAIWCFCSSPTYHALVRRLDQKLYVTNKTLLKVPFDLEYWEKVAAQKYPEGLPQPYSNSPTQWIFHGHPANAGAGLHVAAARLVGYRWPSELETDIELSNEAQEWVAKSKDLVPLVDDDGIVCLPSVRGEAPAADRLRRLLAAAFGGDWSAAKERQLLDAAAGGGRGAATLDEWLRDRFFEEHCALFQQRPFVWHVWDGRRDGFHALVSYHRLAGPDGEGRRTLQALAYAYLGDWIDRQRAEQQEGREGADARVVAALDLQEQLQRILEGQPPCDIFVRWKPVQRQPVGWEPDVNDGVRLNIRPFLEASLRSGGRTGAGVLRWRPNIPRGKDRGKEPESLRPRDDYPWFWCCDPEAQTTHRLDFAGGPTFDGKRWNDLHYSNAVRLAARERERETVRRGTVS